MFPDSDTWQAAITKERVQGMLSCRPRRFRLTDFDQPLNEPRKAGEDWNLRFPFRETFVPAFSIACRVKHIGFRGTPGHPSCYTFLKNVTSSDIDGIRTWLGAIGGHVALRDCVLVSFALDYDKEGGDPGKPQTEIGKLRSRAKPYGSAPTDDTYAAAGELIGRCTAFLAEVRCYNSVNTIVGMPASDPQKPFDLPAHLAQGIASGWRGDDLTGAVRTVASRPPIKDRKLLDKLRALEGTIEVKPDVFKNKRVLLVDDLYQSGVTMNYVAMLLLQAGAKKVFGLACEKTCRNDDNLSRRRT